MTTDSTEGEEAPPASPSPVRGNLTSGRLLARNTLFNLLGQGLPVLVGFVAIPRLIRGLGPERFGVLTLVWLVVGYMGVFDLGVGRALTKLIADRLGQGEVRDMKRLVSTSLALLLALGLGAGTLLALAAPILTDTILKIPPALRSDSRGALLLMAGSVPAVLLTAGFAGVLAAYQRFAILNAIRVPVGVFTFLGPLLALQFSNSLVLITAFLLAGRYLACAAYGVACRHVLPSTLRGEAFDRGLVGTLLRFGGWLTVSSVLGPISAGLDRFLVAGVVSLEAVAYYATSQEVVGKLGILALSVSAVLFPAFATSASRDRQTTASLFGRATKYMFLVLVPMVLALVAFAEIGLTLWLGAEFAARSSVILKWLAVAVLLASFVTTLFSLVQGLGRPDWGALLQLIELPFYTFAIFWFARRFGVLGAAIVSCVRYALEMIALGIQARRLLAVPFPLLRIGLSVAGAAILIGGVALLPPGGVVKGAGFISALLLFSLGAWFGLLSNQEKFLLRVRVSFGRSTS